MRVVRTLVLLAVAGLGLVAVVAWWQWQRVATPYRGFATPEVFVDLPPGTSVSGMAARLADAGVVPDAITFRLAARVSGEERRLKAGEYRFADAASPRDVVDRLVRGDVFTRPLTFPEGLTMAEMADVFARSGVGTAAEFLVAARDVSPIADLDPGARSLEGYLFPDTYTLTRRDTARSVVASMVERFKASFDAPLRAKAAEAGLTVRQVVTLASLIEKETAVGSERPTVAAVYRNRLRIGMLLQCDPTVIYGMMLAGRWRGNISRADLQMDSPYNTYRYPGLPPGPIAAPGRASLEAALAPADVPFLFFVARNDGTHQFSTTLAEHNRAVNQFQRRRTGA